MILLPTHSIGIKPTRLEMAGDMAFWGFGGFLVQTWQNGIMKRPLLSKPHLHLVCSAIGAGVGYLIHRHYSGQMDYLEKQRDMLVRRRMDRMKRDGLLD
ncbi:hypothetical protein BATDEDRAFT_90167 [Batrachochytrium dendrobatidis JAM81]|uniref:Uncharacterized protein n=1 Tax=Batrachochytrium dendrobatidis (strain JAM81 / FGSC 10211) TaxID=684364 RepID=F4P7D8_BATDJ|nr:uncharacterized protein BATDEDRAFT_90167 [Batrachochytrium dendrobatidis JAM81]EGF79090.1 hypothetical protein BATDEDRAFT_90167 [Batrachochytrium dendrobatidis JAM81]KAJ8325209.1 hypothetical protein O5D80_006157 [Batrachochytrium dendrobatidis]KAK5667363.1 hypothetical protein QVD99_005969 [Batrachochytrium dendrobatidis]|eukprot:XP_006680571.1 hypothetical protein BATDEDRAFT_90167 [Batrachochytrium dendrobatidis JAM81]